MCAVCVDFKDRGQGGLFGATRSAYGRKRLFWTLLGALWCPWMALPDLQNCSNASPGMCPDLFHPCSTLFHQFRFWPKKAVFGCFGPCLAALWHTHMALPDQRNGFNASPGMCPDLFHPCSTLFHQFGATRSAYGPKRPFLAVLDPVWPYNWPKWLEQECCLVEQVNPYQNEAENIMGCHGKPTSKNPLHTNTLCLRCLRFPFEVRNQRSFAG